MISAFLKFFDNSPINGNPKIFKAFFNFGNIDSAFLKSAFRLPSHSTATIWMRQYFVRRTMD
ncbi:hypothetical protein BGV46_19415 [Serratia marcescens]|nr:hypothetical protein AB188_19570 [Serratia marcescens]APS33767.1 hypothetical protein RN42_07900 [Serratia marcescens]OHT41588.1 hypothetical protein BGV45_19195 [Serratia marcescens]OHT42616.1 hypothetical protein BGV46_19415 [Serratia marcescens]